MQIPDKSHFQPNKDSLESWLATRKPSHNINGVSLPGLFNDDGNSNDTSWVIAAGAGELLGVGLTIYCGINYGGVFLIISLMLVALMIYLDIFAAKKLHRNEGKKTLLKSNKMFQSDVSDLRKIEDDINSGKSWDFVYKLIIILIAIIKVIALVLLGVFSNLALYLPIMAIFFIVAYIHINHTGFWFAYRNTQKSIDNDYKQFSGGKNIAEIAEINFETKEELNGVPITYNPHEIILQKNADNNNGVYVYTIKAKGVLTDDDIMSLITTKAQSSSNEIPLFKQCRNLQLKNLSRSSRNK